ncbi:MAG: hypothetical protein Q8L48_16705 [Archangium sp.]|nr:hypothetical protein [Archangium sp.]
MLLALVLAQATALGNPQGPIFSQPSLMGSEPAFAFATSSGRGLPYIQDLCSTITSSEKVGDWFCLKGDGTMATGSQQTLAYTGAGSGATENIRICPNGPDCLPNVPVLRTNATAGSATGGWYGADVATGASVDVSVCQAFIVGMTNDYENFFFKGNTSSTIDVLFQKSTGTDDVAVYVSNILKATAGTTKGAWHLLCLTYAASGTALNIYLDGTSIHSSSATALFNNTGAWRVSGYNNGLFPVRVESVVGGSFMTKAVLTPARVAAISHAVLADQPTNGRGDLTVATVRSTVRTCASSDNQVVSVLPANRACVSSGRIKVRQTLTSPVLRAEEFGNASWQKNGSAGRVPVVTENYAIAPDGTKTADRLETPACTGGSEYSRLFQAIVPGVANASFCVMLKGNGTSGSLPMLTLTGFPAQTVTCTYNATTWTPCLFENLTVTAGAENLYIGPSGAGGPWAANDVLLWAAWGAAGANCGPHIPTTSAAVTHNAESAFSFDSTALVAAGYGTHGSFSATILPRNTVAAQGLGHMDTAGRMLYLNTTLRMYDGTTEPTLAAGIVVGTAKRYASQWFSATMNLKNVTDATSNTGAFDGTMTTTGYPSAGRISFCASGAIGSSLEYECGDVCLDAEQARCYR